MLLDSELRYRDMGSSSSDAAAPPESFTRSALPVCEQPVDLCLRQSRRQPLPEICLQQRRPPVNFDLGGSRDEFLELPAEPDVPAEMGDASFERQDRACNPPPGADAAQDVAFGHERAVKEHLVEFVVAICLAQRPYLHAVLREGDEHHAQPGMPPLPRAIRPHQREAVVRVLSAAGPEFLAGYPPAGVRWLSAGPDASEV